MWKTEKLHDSDNNQNNVEHIDSEKANKMLYNSYSEFEVDWVE